MYFSPASVAHVQEEQSRESYRTGFSLPNAQAVIYN